MAVYTSHLGYGLDWTYDSMLQEPWLKILLTRIESIFFLQWIISIGLIKSSTQEGFKAFLDEYCPQISAESKEYWDTGDVWIENGWIELNKSDFTAAYFRRQRRLYTEFD